MDIFNYVCGYAHVTYVQMPPEASDCGSGTGVEGTCQPPDPGFWESNLGTLERDVCASPLRHLSSFCDFI